MHTSRNPYCLYVARLNACGVHVEKSVGLFCGEYSTPVFLYHICWAVNLPKGEFFPVSGLQNISLATDFWKVNGE